MAKSGTGEIDYRTVVAKATELKRELRSLLRGIPEGECSVETLENVVMELKETLERINVELKDLKRMSIKETRHVPVRPPVVANNKEIPLNMATTAEGNGSKDLDSRCREFSATKRKTKEDKDERNEPGDMMQVSNPIRFSSCQLPFDISGATIHGNVEERNPMILLPNQANNVFRLALDIGGSLTKLVYFSRHEDCSAEIRKNSTPERLRMSNGNQKYPICGGKLHFMKFETVKLNECLHFISSKQLHVGGRSTHSCRSGASNDNGVVIKATGGGAHKFADIFQERLGINLDKEEEMDCLVNGANFLLKTIHHEAFTHMEGRKEFVQIDQNSLFPYLLVNIGSGVSMIKVIGDGNFQRVGGIHVGGGTCLALGKHLTKCKSFDELLELSRHGDNKKVDMLVGDIYGMDYGKIGLSKSAIASSFAKSVSENKELSEYRPEDLSSSVLLMHSYLIGLISSWVARFYGLKRIYFGGFFIRGHPFIMDSISFAVNLCSKEQVQAMFLRHDGFLGALGAFMKNDKSGM
ncbi:pantothenate kinase 2-like [Aristolochia californica]|uniref:pantothenate kinase 2-like n=1 Tax=Aristolochia californica TaxID=171875 RepID=UPI0035E00572